MNERLRILLIDDDENEYLLLQKLFSERPEGKTTPDYRLDWASKYEDALRAFLECQYDVYLVNYQLRDRSGLDLLRESAVKNCAAPAIILINQENHEINLAAMQLGAADYLDKSHLTLPLFERSVRYAIDRKLVEAYLHSLLTERTQALAQLRKQAKEINALQKATTSLLSTLEIPRLLGQIMDAAQEAIPSAERV